MMRKRFFTWLLLLLLVNALASVSALDDWPVFKHDLEGSSYNSAFSDAYIEDLDLLWSYSTGSRVSSSPVAGDLDGDGLLEIAVGSSDGSLYVFDYQGNLLWSYQTGGLIDSAPAIGNLSLGNTLDVVVGSSDGKLYALNSRGELLWTYATGDEIHSSPLIVNVDDGRQPEVVFGSDDRYLYAVDFLGRLKWRYKATEAIRSSPSAADVDGGGDLEIIFGSEDNTVYMLKPPGYKVWRYPTNGDVSSSPAVYDIDDDGAEEIVVGSGDGKIYSLYYHQSTIMGCTTRRVCDEDGCTNQQVCPTTITPEWNYTTGAGVYSSPAVADLDGDYYYEVIVGSTDKVLYVLSSEGEKLMKYSLSKPIYSSPAVADLDDDGEFEIIFGSDDGTLYVINYPGGKVWSYATNGSIKSSPAIADLNSDGTLEFMVGSSDGSLYVFGSEYAMIQYGGYDYYMKAEKYYGAGDLDTARIYANKSLHYYLDLGGGVGAEMAEDMLDKIQADYYFQEAEDYYEQGDLITASHYLEDAYSLYYELNHTQRLSRTEDFIDRIDADTYYLEAELYYEAGDMDNANAVGKKALELYEGINYTVGILKTKLLLNESAGKEEADKYYSAAVESYYEGDIENTTGLADDALEVYREINYSKGIKLVEDLLKRVEADKYFLQAQVYFNASNYKNASEYAARARNIYTELSYLPAADNANDLVNKSIAYVTAEDSYMLALEYYNRSNYKSAVEYSQKARDHYLLAGDSEAAARADELLNRSTTMNRYYSARGNEVYIGVGVIILAGVVIAVVNIFIRAKDSLRKKEIKPEQGAGSVLVEGSETGDSELLASTQPTDDDMHVSTESTEDPIE